MSDFVYPWCPECDKNFPVRKDIYEGLENCGNTFYCLHGHPLKVSRTSIVSELRTTNRRLALNIVTVSRLSKRIESLRGVQTRQRNRLLRGACPYCGKIPVNMVGHIQKHHNPKIKT